MFPDLELKMAAAHPIAFGFQSVAAAFAEIPGGGTGLVELMWKSNTFFESGILSLIDKFR